MEQLHEVLASAEEGRCPLYLDYRNAKARARVALGERWRVLPTEELLGRLRRLLGADNVRIAYGEIPRYRMAPPADALTAMAAEA